MKNLLLTAAFSGLGFATFAQCDLSQMPASGSVSPANFTLNEGCQGGTYADTMYYNFSSDFTTQINVPPIGMVSAVVSADSIIITDVSGYPAGLSHTCNCTPADKMGCIIISGTPTASGTFTVNVTADLYGEAFVTGIGLVPLNPRTIPYTLNLTITPSSGLPSPAEIVTSPSGDTLLASPFDINNPSLYNYQWLDCNNGNAPVAGATDFWYAPGNSGSYAVEVTNNCGGSDVSDCYNLVLAINDVKATEQNVRTFPNPTTGVVSLAFDQHLQNADLRVVSITGQTLQQLNNVSGNVLEVDLSAYSQGIFFLEVSTQNTVYRTKVMKN